MRELFEPCSHHFYLKNSTGDVVGELTVQLVVKIDRPRYSDYQLMGVELSTIIAVDFSSTSFDYFTTNIIQHSETDSLSYRNLMNHLFDELRMIIAGRPITVFGFGNTYEPGKSSIFPLSKSRPQLDSFDSIIHEYRVYRDQAQYTEEAALAPVIAEARKCAPINWEENKAVTFLVVLTNGKFCDVQEAIDQLVEAENEPIVVAMVIIGTSRRKIENYFGMNSTLKHSDGKRTSSRTIASVFHFGETNDSSLPVLSSNIHIATKKMFVDYLDSSSFKPFANTKPITI